MANKFFISDTHWGHTKAIQYDNRPFKSVEEMDEAMINNWNSVVRKQDEVYHLGDFAFMEEDAIERVRRRLNGNIYFIKGNHDSVIMRSTRMKALFGWTREYYELKSDGLTFCLFHYPIGEWNKAHRGAYHLHGHCHGHYEYPREGKIMDVGAPCIGYTPIELSEVVARLRNKPDLQHH